MANDTSGVGSKPPVTPVSEIGNQPKATPKKADELGQQEFLTMLVNQLQNQDPLNPMNSEEFAVQLAQFSSLERLISIDKRLEGLGGTGGADPIASMASYLGHEVVVKDAPMSVEDGKGSNLLVDVPGGTQSLRVDFLDADGKVIGRHNIEEVTPGSSVLNLEGMDVANGKYDVRVVSVDANGQFKELDAKVTGTVEGFVLEPEPMLLVNGEQVPLENISEVYTGRS